MTPRTPLHAWIAQLVGVAPEALRLEHVRAWQLEALRRTLDYAVANSPYYGERLRMRGDDLCCLDDLAGLPFTTPEDLRRDPLRLLCVSQGEIERVVTMDTSGTTGRPKRLFFTSDDLERTTDFFAHGMATMVGSGGRVLLFMPGQRPGSVGDLLARGLRRIGVTCHCHGFVQDLDEAVRAIAAHGSDCLVGIPSQILAVARHGRLTGLLRPGDVGSVLLSGDPVTPALRDAIAQALGCEVFAHYGLTETGLGGGVECRAQAGAHLREADLYVEIVDPVSGQLLPAGQEGEVVLTTLSRRGMPLLRYRTGDLGRLLSEPCPCGTSLPRLAVLGRGDACVRLAHGCLEPATLDEALWPMEGLSFHEALLTHQDEADILRVALWSPMPPAHHQRLLDEARSRITETPGLRDALRDNSLRLTLVMSEDASCLPPPGKRRIRDLRPREDITLSTVV
ncbi:coenzyme F390 synthetase [Desulfocurvibacter africanus PCS]|uniref:Coenzyme F390 synthetase n=1 Tax=Desulfocurvibacter africanus PCS TaxID=1262666 RepID=M5PQT1_DESAF|nr:AMP-binding protein [Desulfocurvibacter africanus]EMG36400.1 coenzyme F390 synthetase [Desulfocurvibacter africanus PCS]